MKLKGILSSKSRRAVHERNRDRKAPIAPDGRLSPEGHKPRDGANGTIICTCGGSRYSPAAFAMHLAGGAMRDGEAGVYTVGPSDPWTAAQQPERARQGTEDVDAAWRRDMVDRYFEQRRRAPRVAEGVSGSAFFG
ncbi:MAG: hypothetical protein ACT4P9_12520 [Betaproteobacteria bacterium]